MGTQTVGRWQGQQFSHSMIKPLTDDEGLSGKSILALKVRRLLLYPRRQQNKRIWLQYGQAGLRPLQGLSRKPLTTAFSVIASTAQEGSCEGARTS